MHMAFLLLIGLAGFGVPLAANAQTGPVGMEPSRIAPKRPGDVIMPDHVDFAVKRDIVDAALAPFNIDFRSYENQLVEAKTGFTQQGWDEFAAISGLSERVDQVIQRKLQCRADLYARLNISPVASAISAEGYLADLRIQETCETPSQASSNLLHLRAVVIRTSAPTQPARLAIDHVSFDPQP